VHFSSPIYDIFCAHLIFLHVITLIFREAPQYEVSSILQLRSPS
jgi:membrane-bound acyltransferase YfiQ involved in biofilm formation